MNKCTTYVHMANDMSPITARTGRYAKKLCGAVAMTLVSIAASVSHAQAPIRDRSESAAPVEGARRAADVAANALTAAETRANIASERRKKAEAALIEAQRELEAARQESTAATAEVTKTRKADAEARAALGKLLDARSK